MIDLTKPGEYFQHRTLAIAAVVAVLALTAAFSAGRFSGALKVETRDVERVVFKDRVQVVEKVVRVETAAKVETRIVWRDRVIEVSGRVVEREVEKTGATTTAEATTAAESTRVEIREVERVKLVEKTVTLRPSWRVGVLVGASFQQSLLPISGPLVLGAEAQYRLVGGLWAGLWTLPQHGAVGASLALEF